MPRSSNFGLVSHLQALAMATVLLCAQGCAAAFDPTGVERNLERVKAGHYQLDQHHATLLFKVGHMGLSPYVGRFNQFDVDLQFDPTRPIDTVLTAIIDTDSIDVNYPSFASELSGPEWFDSERFPEARFVSTAVRKLGDNRLAIDGELTLMGTTAPVSLEASFLGATPHAITGIYTLGFTASGRFKRSAFGLDNYIPVVDDEVTIELYLELKRAGNR